MAKLMPSRVKWRKQQRGVMRGNATRGNKIGYGEFGLQALEPGRINGRQIEAGRMAASRFVAREGKIFIRIFAQELLQEAAGNPAGYW